MKTDLYGTNLHVLEFICYFITHTQWYIYKGMLFTAKTLLVKDPVNPLSIANLVILLEPLQVQLDFCDHSL